MAVAATARAAMNALVSAVEAVVEALGGVGGTHAKHNIARVADISVTVRACAGTGQKVLRRCPQGSPNGFCNRATYVHPIFLRSYRFVYG